MKKEKLSVVLSASVFVVTEIILYALFLAEDFGGAQVGENVWLKYSTVCLAFVFALFFFFISLYKKTEWKDSILLLLGLAFTLVSDMFLLVRMDHLEVGVATFICAQVCYFARIHRTRLWVWCSVGLRILLPSIAIIVLASLHEANALYILVAIYFVQLVMNCAENVVLAIVAKDKVSRIQGIILSIGFLMFIGCDICVGLTNIYDGMAVDLIWLFYTPSQVLIALSSRRIYEE